MSSFSVVLMCMSTASFSLSWVLVLQIVLMTPRPFLASGCPATFVAYSGSSRGGPILPSLASWGCTLAVITAVCDHWGPWVGQRLASGHNQCDNVLHQLSWGSIHTIYTWSVITAHAIRYNHTIIQSIVAGHGIRVRSPIIKLCNRFLFSFKQKTWCLYFVEITLKH